MDKTKCPHAVDCALYPTLQSSQLTALWMTLFCNDPNRYPDCARYKLSLEGKAVPAGLLPNGSILGGAKS